jgi:hypothetical protein
VRLFDGGERFALRVAALICRGRFSNLTSAASRLKSCRPQHQIDAAETHPDVDNTTFHGESSTID